MDLVSFEKRLQKFSPVKFKTSKKWFLGKAFVYKHHKHHKSSLPGYLQYNQDQIQRWNHISQCLCEFDLVPRVLYEWIEDYAFPFPHFACIGAEPRVQGTSHAIGHLSSGVRYIQGVNEDDKGRGDFVLHPQENPTMTWEEINQIISGERCWTPYWFRRCGSSYIRRLGFGNGLDPRFNKYESEDPQSEEVGR